MYIYINIYLYTLHSYIYVYINRCKYIYVSMYIQNWRLKYLFP